MKFCILGSSSSGNSSFLEVANNKFLIDVGFSIKKLNEKLNKINERIENINYIFITHEHIDHIKSLGPILRKYDIKVFIHKDSFDVIKDKIGNYNKDKIIYIDFNKISINEVVISNFKLNHDAKCTLGYSFEYMGKKLVYITDTGYISKLVEQCAKDTNILAIESNYDYDMLMLGNYPWDVKNRIKSKNGHLSNKDVLKLIDKLDKEKLKKVFLMHLSEENNHEAIAKNNIESVYPNLDVEISNEDITKIFEF